MHGGFKTLWTLPHQHASPHAADVHEHAADDADLQLRLLGPAMDAKPEPPRRAEPAGRTVLPAFRGGYRAAVARSTAKVARTALHRTTCTC